MHPQDDSAREAALAATIPLLHHVPARRPFPFESFAPANVRTADDLPPYLLLGALDPKSFAITPEGWSADYRGHEPGTAVRFEHRSDPGTLALGTTWRGTQGVYSQISTSRPLSRLFQQWFLVPPTRWGQAAKELLEREFHLCCVPPGPRQFPLGGVPDGHLWTILFPVAVPHLRQLRGMLELAAGVADYPVVADACLVRQEVHYVEGRAPEGAGSGTVAFAPSFAEACAGPLQLVREQPPDGLAAAVLRRPVHLARITVPFAGLTDLLKSLRALQAPIRGTHEAPPRVEHLPCVLPCLLEFPGRPVEVWDAGRTTRVVWHLGDPGSGPASLLAGVAIAGSPAGAGLRQAEAAHRAQHHPGKIHVGELEDDFANRLLQRLPELLRRRRFRKEVLADLDERGPAVVAAVCAGEALEPEVWDELRDIAVNAFARCARRIVTLEWDTGSPIGGCGFSAVEAVGEVYVFVSSDWAREGPFDSWQEAVADCESFSIVTTGPSVQSKVLSRKQLLEVAKGVADLDSEDVVQVNEEWFVARGGELVPKEGA